MKKITLIATVLSLALSANAQLKVSSNGQVSIGTMSSSGPIITPTNGNNVDGPKSALSLRNDTVSALRVCGDIGTSSRTIAFGNGTVYYSPLLTEGKVWIFEQLIRYPDRNSVEGDSEITVTFSASVREDVELNGEKGKNVIVHYITSDIPEIIPIHHDLEYDLFEIDNIVYWRHWYTNSMLQLIPFNLLKGDRVVISDEYGPIDWIDYPYVESKDSFSLNGHTYSRWIIQDSMNFMKNNQIDDIIVESIGSVHGAWKYIHLPLADDGITYFTPKLLEVYDNGELIFTYEDFFTGLEGASVNAVQNEREWRDNSIYDLYGNKVINPQPGSVYIRSGKKYIAR